MLFFFIISKFSSIFITVAALDDAEPSPAWYGKFLVIVNNKFGYFCFKNEKIFLIMQSLKILFFGANFPV